MSDLSDFIQRRVEVMAEENESLKKEVTKPDFSNALRAVKTGAAISRTGWNGKGLKVKAQFPLPYLYIVYPNGDSCPWAASQTDLMAEDWVWE